MPDLVTQQLKALEAEINRLRNVERLALELASQIEIHDNGSTLVKDAGFGEYNNPVLQRFWQTIRNIVVVTRRHDKERADAH
jgi:hypothetical protein